MIDITIEKIKYQIPGDWAEVTVEQFAGLVKNAKQLDPVRVLSILTKLDYDALNNMDCSGFLEVIPAISWIGKPLEMESLPRYNFITIDGQQIPTIQKPGKETIGQKMMMVKLISKAAGEDEPTIQNIPDLIPAIVANYYCPYLHPDKIWKEEHYEKVMRHVMVMPIVQAVPECNFFLLGYIKSARKKEKHSLSQHPI